MEIPAEQSGELHHAELWKRVKGELPPAAEDAETHTDRQEKGENAWRWRTTHLLMVGWLRKD
ncbi:hypothetical protein [Streptomyces sp. NPDC023588]|uniref:hypothetical protein n=1 Tax=Streptomyces sp. NPDC023588 TaxID=3154907 RepID=UPI0033D48271